MFFGATLNNVSRRSMLMNDLATADVVSSHHHLVRFMTRAARVDKCPFDYMGFFYFYDLDRPPCRSAQNS
jgi:hypothetical protein